MKDIEVPFQDFRTDLERYRSHDESWRRIMLNPGVWCLFWYRLGRWLYDARRSVWIVGPAKLVHLVGSTFVEAVMQMRLNTRARIKGGLYIAHCGAITVHPDVVIGSRCDLAHGVTLGTRGAGGQGVPCLGDGVYVGTNAVLIGPIMVGDGARIAANSLVTRDVPPGATVMGVPAKVVKTRQPSYGDCEALEPHEAR